MEWENTLMVMDRYGQAILDEYKSSLKNSGHMASGNLYNTAKYRIKREEGVFKVEMELAEYWKYLENGTKPHFPPIDSILRWIKDKGIVPREENGKLPTEKQLAFLISRKISEVGTPATGLLQQAQNTMANTFKSQISDALSMDINNMIDTNNNG